MRSYVSWVDSEYILYQSLEFRIAIRAPFPLVYLGERIDIANVLGIELRGLVEVGDRRIETTLLAVQNTQQIVDVPILGRELACLFETLRCKIEISLAQCQQTPIGPTGGLRGGKPSDGGEALVSASVVPDLQGRYPNVEGFDNLVVLTGCRIWEDRTFVTAKDHGDKRQCQHSASK